MNKKRFEVRRPPRSQSPEAATVEKIHDPLAAERFISGAAAAEAAPAPAAPKPLSTADEILSWVELDDVRRGKVDGATFNIRLTAREEAIIRFITKHERVSKHSLIMNAVRPALVEHIKQATGADISTLFADQAEG